MIQVNGISFGIATHLGKERSINQDATGAWINSGPGPIRAIFVLADGMGGGTAGEEASMRLVTGILDIFSCWSGSSSNTDILCEIKNAIVSINREIYDLSRAKMALAMGTTADIAIVTESQVLIAHVGDGRVYQVDQLSSTQLTEDHSALNDLVKQGVPLETAVQHVGGNQVTHMVGTGGAVAPRIDPTHHDIVPGQTFLLCCDGVHGGLEKAVPFCMGPEDYAAFIQSAGTLQSAAEKVVIEAVKRDGSDNATCLIFRLGDESPVMPAEYVPGTKVILPGNSFGDLSNVHLATAAEKSPLPETDIDHTYQATRKQNSIPMYVQIAVAVVIGITVAILAVVITGEIKDGKNKDASKNIQNQDELSDQVTPSKPEELASRGSNTGNNREFLQPEVKIGENFIAVQTKVQQLVEKLINLEEDIKDDTKRDILANKDISKLEGLDAVLEAWDGVWGSKIEITDLNRLDAINAIKINDDSGLLINEIVVSLRDKVYDLIEAYLLRLCATKSPADRIKGDATFAFFGGKTLPKDQITKYFDFLLGLNLLADEREENLQVERDAWIELFKGSTESKLENSTHIFNRAEFANKVWTYKNEFDSLKQDGKLTFSEADTRLRELQKTSDSVVKKGDDHELTLKQDYWGIEKLWDKHTKVSNSQVSINGLIAKQRPLGDFDQIQSAYDAYKGQDEKILSLYPGDQGSYEEKLDKDVLESIVTAANTKAEGIIGGIESLHEKVTDCNSELKNVSTKWISANFGKANPASIKSIKDNVTDYFEKGMFGKAGEYLTAQLADVNEYIINANRALVTHYKRQFDIEYNLIKDYLTQIAARDQIEGFKSDADNAYKEMNRLNAKVAHGKLKSAISKHINNKKHEISGGISSCSSLDRAGKLLLEINNLEDLGADSEIVSELRTELKNNFTPKFLGENKLEFKFKIDCEKYGSSTNDSITLDVSRAFKWADTYTIYRVKADGGSSQHKEVKSLFTDLGNFYEDLNDKKLTYSITAKNKLGYNITKKISISLEKNLKEVKKPGKPGKPTLRNTTFGSELQIHVTWQYSGIDMPSLFKLQRRIAGETETTDISMYDLKPIGDKYIISDKSLLKPGKYEYCVTVTSKGGAHIAEGDWGSIPVEVQSKNTKKALHYSW